MKCPNCGNLNKESSKYCFKCGFKLETHEAPIPMPQEVNQPAAPPLVPLSPVTAPIFIQNPAGNEDLSTRPLSCASLIFKGTDRQIQIPFKTKVLMGRGDRQNNNLPDIDFTDIDKDKVTSRRHGYITYSGGRYKIVDEGSMNGTFLNGTKLDTGIDYDLKDGDEIIFGKLVCIFTCIG